MDSFQKIDSNTNSSFPTYGSLSTGCRIRFSEDFHSHICYDAHLRIQWRQKEMEVLQMFRRKAEKRMVELPHVPSRFMRKFICRLRLSEVNRQ